MCGHHFQQTGHQPDMVANPARSGGQFRIAREKTKSGKKQETDKKQTSSSYVGTLGGSTLLGHVRI